MIGVRVLDRRRGLRRGRRGPRRPARARRRSTSPTRRATRSPAPAPPWPLLAAGRRRHRGRPARDAACASPASSAPPAPGRTASPSWRRTSARSTTSPSSATAGRMVADLLGADDVALMSVTGDPADDRRAGLRAPRQLPGEPGRSTTSPPPRYVVATGRVRPGRRRRQAGDPAELAELARLRHRRDADGPGRIWAAAAAR